MKAKRTKYFTGNDGRVWINDELYGDCYKAEAKKTNNYEEIPDPESGGNIQVPNGYSIEGSLTLRKVGNESILKALKEDKNNELDCSVIIKEKNALTGVTERVKYTGVTFDEVPLSIFEKRTITEIELSFKAEDYDVLD